MSRLDVAMERFSESLDRLDGVVSRRLQRARSNEGMERELAALKADRARLAQELDSVKSEAKALEGVTDEVSNRLDTAIRDIRAVLEL